MFYFVLFSTTLKPKLCVSHLPESNKRKAVNETAEDTQAEHSAGGNTRAKPSAAGNKQRGMFLFKTKNCADKKHKLLINS